MRATWTRGLAIATLAAVGATPAAAATCTQQFDSTFALLRSIFEHKGCTSAFCHDSAASGGLDLTAPDLYDHLVDAPVRSIASRPGLHRITPAKKENSLLWLNVAAATLPGQWSAPLRAMPLGGLPPLTLNELQVLQLWIEEGAPREGVVPGTGELVDACLPPPEPLETKPLDPPAPGTGIQLRAPRQVLAPHSEREVCFVTYYDLTDQVPPEFRGPSGDTVRYKHIDARQDPLSHHAVVIPYRGAATLTSPVWGPFTCGGGARDGAACDPSDLGSCGDDGVCGSQPTPSVACIGYGPGDAGIGVGNDSLFNTMAAGLGSVSGVYAEAPLRGMLVWNSHAFNVTDQPGKLDIWLNLEFAAPAEQRYPLQRFTEVFEQFRLAVPAFGAQELCARYVVPPGASIIELSSHNHKRGKRFRIWEGAFTCTGGSNVGKPCSPAGVEPGLDLDDPCDGAPCSAPNLPRVGDCDQNQHVTVDEVLLGVNIALGQAPVDSCRRFDGDDDNAVSVDELLAAVDALLNPVRDADESLLYTSLSYSDPAVARFDPPLRLGGAGSSETARTLTYCSLYDNGATDPAQVKRQSTSPLPTNGFPGGPCRQPLGCTGGRIGAACTGNTPAQRDASCDSTSGAGDGDCDACPVAFGVTTDDEMFIILGAYFVE
ncbi:MAG TPA: hypothetical protein VL049_12325 [Candidatus Dormibacteraeota bacterium]|nr:hypothetical protein [Candidatus Dormibacteraeota bacterium]